MRLRQGAVKVVALVVLILVSSGSVLVLGSGSGSVVESRGYRYRCVIYGIECVWNGVDSSRQIEESISILNFFPPYRGVDFYFEFLPAKSRARARSCKELVRSEDCAAWSACYMLDACLMLAI